MNLLLFPPFPSDSTIRSHIDRQTPRCAQCNQECGSSLPFLDLTSLYSLDQWFLTFSVTFPTLEHPDSLFPTKTLTYDVK